MKYILLLLITLSACHVKKENTQNQDLTRLNDIWALSLLQGEDFDRTKTRKHPTIEIYVAEKRVVGNDGCNNVMGGIEVLTSTELKFGMLAGTKMMCQNMEVSNAFGKLLAQIRTYTLKELKLHLYDEKGNELMVFKKVD